MKRELLSIDERLQVYTDVLFHWDDEKNGFCSRIRESLLRLGFYQHDADPYYCFKSTYPELWKRRPDHMMQWDLWYEYTESGLSKRKDILISVINELKKEI
jgi:hypothetical protein